MVHSYLVWPGTIPAYATDRSHPDAHLALHMMENKMSETDIVESFPAMLRRVLGDRLEPGVTTFPDMFAADGVLEYPYALPGLSTPLVGRDAIVANFQIIRKLLRVDNVTEVVVHETDDPQVVMIEFAGHGEGLITREPYDQRYISVVRVSEGHIVHYKDYWNPLALLRTLKGEEVMKAVAMD
jgi:ketosteroid isomerase-like protein